MRVARKWVFPHMDEPFITKTKSILIIVKVLSLLTILANILREIHDNDWGNEGVGYLFPRNKMTL